MGLENARVENNGQKLRGLENAGLENDGQTFSHPNFFNFLTHLQNVTVDNMADLQRLKRGVEIRIPKKKRNL